MKTIKLLAIAFISVITLNACSDDHDHDHDHEEELITTLIYTLTDGSNTVTLQFEDLDGDGGNPGAPSVTGQLLANTSYTGAIQLLNKTENPAEDKTSEIQSESAEHEFFYATTGGITIAKTDQDSNGNGFGLATTLSTGNAGNGTVTIILKHNPTKPNDGTASGAGGSTDIEVTIPVTIQ